VRKTIEDDGFVPRDDGQVEPAPTPEPEPEAAPEPIEVLAAANGDPPAWMRSEDGDADLPPIRGGAVFDPTEVRDNIAGLRAQIRSLGPVNEQAANDYEESRTRYDYLNGQLADLNDAQAQLDEANVGRFVEELRDLSQRTQFIIITHNRRTIETADTIYGVSMGADSVSRVLSLRLADIEADLD